MDVIARRFGRVPFVAGVLAVSVSACGQGDESRDAVQPPPPHVVVATVHRQSVPIVNDYQGTINAIESVDVRARVQGVLESAHFKEGTLVRKGQLIFSLQKDQYQAALLSAQAQTLTAKANLTQATGQVPVQQAQAQLAQKEAMLDRANITVARVRPLAADKALPQKDLDNALSSQASALADVDAAKAQLTNAKVTQQGGIDSAKAAVLSAKAAVDNAQINLGYTDIHAPVTGLIGFLKYDVGNVVGDTPSTQVLDTITTVDPIKANFAVDENTYLALSGLRGTSGVPALRDQALTLILANNAVYPLTGRLYAVNPTLDAKTGTIAVEARFPNPDGVLRPGNFARVRLTVENRPNALLMPTVAIGVTQGVSTAYTVDANNVASLHTVSLGPQIGQDSIVQSGLQAGDRVVVAGAQKLQPGMKVVLGRGAGPSPAP